MNVKPGAKNKNSLRAKLIFNPGAGVTGASPVQLMDVISEMQSWKIIPEPFLIEPGCNLDEMIHDALSQGVRMFVVCGGDGTISSVARLLTGTHATLGIIPLGTKNNTAISLGIPTDIPTAIANLRIGNRIKIDVGVATCGEISTPFLEVCSVGLISTLFPSADDIQHGNLARIGDFLTTLTSSPPAEIRLLLDSNQEIHDFGYVVLVSNMSYIGLNYKVGTEDSFEDGLLDVLFFGNLSKLDLLGYVFQGVGTGELADPRIQRFHVRRVDINTHPSMPVMVDGITLGEGLVRIKVHRHALRIMVGKQIPEIQPQLGESFGRAMERDAAIA
jgi:diacylglycerol kinase (ATP)